MLKNVPLFGVGNKGSPNVSAQKRVNLYVEMQDDPESNGLCCSPRRDNHVREPRGQPESRGSTSRTTWLYVVNGGTLWEISANGTLTSRGTLLTTGGRVDITDNGAQMLIVDGTFGYIYTFATNTLAQITTRIFRHRPPAHS
jgi:hypothetical protein